MPRSVCKGCEQTARDAVKLRDRWRPKVGDCIRRHARRLDLEPDVLRHEYGWDITRMAHDAEHTYENWCPYCAQPFALMDHGLADITLDIFDPSQPPYYGVNTRWICATCNREKGRTSPSEWAALLAAWERWRRRKDDLGSRRQLTIDELL